MNNQAFELLMDRMDRIETKVDQVLEFKWKIIGGTVLASIIMTGLFQIVILFYKP